jgi:anaerobic ribonucleoside-triphosphate reductase
MDRNTTSNNPKAQLTTTMAAPPVFHFKAITSTLTNTKTAATTTSKDWKMEAEQVVEQVVEQVAGQVAEQVAEQVGKVNVMRLLTLEKTMKTTCRQELT